MTKRKAAHIIRHHFKRLYKHAGKMKRSFTEDAIHDFRVDYKMLRAFSRMLRLKTAQPGDLKFPHSLKKMYTTAGQIRDRQLCLKRIKADRQAGRSVVKKVHQLRREIKEFADNATFLSQKEFNTIGTKMIKSIPAVLPVMSGKDFVCQKLAFINHIIGKKEYSDKDLHDARKGLKDIVFITAIYKSFNEETPAPSWNEEDIKSAEAMAHELGSFNDAGIALSFLSPREIRKAGIEEGRHLWTIRRHWLAQKRKLKKRVLANMNNMNLAIASGT